MWKRSAQAAYTGGKGDGIIYISPVDSVVRISTGEEDMAALSYVSENGKGS